MGGKGSKQKVKITKAESGGKHSHGKTKEQKEPVENGETVTEKSAHSGATSNETGDHATKKNAVAKSQKAATELAEKRADIESTGKTQKESALQPKPVVVEQVQHLSEARPVETQLASEQSSPRPEEKKTEILQEESAKEEEPEKFDKIEVVEKKLDEPAAPQDEPHTKQLAEIIEDEPSAAHTEQVQNKCDKEEEEDNPPATSIDTPTIEAASGDTAVEAKEINGPVELTKCEGDGLEQSILLSAEQDS